MAIQAFQFRKRSSLKYLSNKDEVSRIGLLWDTLPSLLAVVAFLFGGIENVCYKLSSKPLPFWLPDIIKVILIIFFWVYYYYSIKIISKKRYHAFSRITRYAANMAAFLTIVIVVYNLFSSFYSPSATLPNVIATIKWENWNITKTDKKSRVYSTQIKLPMEYKAKYRYSSISIRLTPLNGFTIEDKVVDPPSIFEAKEKHYFTNDSEQCIQVYFENFNNTKKWFFKVKIHKGSKIQNWPNLPFQAYIELRGR